MGISVPLETFEKRPLLPNLGVRLKFQSSKYLKVFLAVPMKIGRVRILAFLDLEQN